MNKMTEEKVNQYVKHYPIANRFSFPIHEHMTVYEFERNEWIVREGVKPDALIYMVEGKAKIYTTHQNGKVSLINFVKPGDYIGEMELLHEDYYSKGIQASTRTVCYNIPLSTCREKLLEDVVFLRELAIFLSKKATFMSTKSSQSQAFPLENRLAHFILELADQGVYREKHVTVCDYLGVSYRHLLHVLQTFCEKGYLDKDGRAYRIHNDEALQLLAQGLR